MDLEAGEHRQPSFLKRLDKPAGEALLRMGTIHQIQAGDLVMHAGEPGDHVALLEAGYVKVTSTDPAGNTVILDVGGPGDLYGEIAVVSGRRRMADVVALADLSARRIDAQNFHHFLRQYPTATYELLVQTSSRLDAAQQQRTHTRAPETITRVARRLAYLVGVCGAARNDGWELVAPLSQEELAAFIPLGRTALATALDQLREQGVIATRRRALTVLDLEHLHRIAGM